MFCVLVSSMLMGSLVTGEASEPPPKNIRVIVEYIEVPHELVTGIMVSEHADSGPKLHAHMRTLIKEKKARILETSIATSRSGQKATVESIMEHISPTESEYVSIPNSISSAAREGQAEFYYPPHLRPECPTAFETRNVGVTFEIEPMLSQQKGLIDLRFAPELVDLLRYETWVEHKDQWGDASVRRPTYESLRFSAGIALEDGKFGFVGLLTPKNSKGGRDTTRKVMFFARADIMTPGS